MNPDNDLNAGTGAGAGAAPSEPAPVDFTGTGAGTNGLSMADSLASAQDNLTSAGLAAKPQDSNSIGLDQIGASDPSASMARPDEPLVPAPPVPGSIGSAISGEKLPTNPEAALASANAAANSEPAVQAPYNPFAAMNTNTTSNSNAPTSTAAQPTAETFPMTGAGAGGAKSKILPLVLGGLAALFAVAAVIFFILWQQEMKNERIVYTPAPVVEDNNPTQTTPRETVMVCTREVTDADMGVEGLVNAQETTRLGFKEGTLDSFAQDGSFVFGDETQAQNAFGEMQLAMTLFGMISGADLGEGLVQNGNTLSYSMTLDLQAFAAASGDDLASDDGSISMSMNFGELRLENGAIVNADQDTLISDYRNAGYTCVSR